MGVKTIYHKTHSLVVPSEEKEQMDFVKWLRIMKLPHTHIANERMCSVIFRKKLAYLGVSSGFPDLVVFLPQKIVFIEMKRTQKAKISPLQQQWLDEINCYDYAVGKVCFGSGEAINFIKELMSGN